MLVTNPAARAPLSEVLSHPWMLRGFRGPPDSHLVHREPLRADELDRNVIKGMKGFEFGTEEDIERKLVEVLESDAYYRSVQYWERKRMNLNGAGGGAGGRNGHGHWGGSLSNSSIALSYDSTNGTKTSESTLSPKKSKRSSGFDFYRKKLFSPSSSPPTSPLNSPPTSQSHLSHTSLTDQREPADPTYGFHPLISIYFLAREKMEREKVYGPGHFASSQLSLESNGRATSASAAAAAANNGESAVEAPPPIPTTAKVSSSPAVRKNDAAGVGAKPDYSMPLPRLPAPETSHFSGMSYEASAATPSPTAAGFPQPRARDPALALNVPKRDSRTPEARTSTTSPMSATATLPRAPAASAHRRSHSLSQRPTVTTSGWTNMFRSGLAPEPVDEMGVMRAGAGGDVNMGLGEPPRTAGPELTSFAEQLERSQREREREHERERERERDQERRRDDGREKDVPLSAGATLVRKFGSLLGSGRDSTRYGTAKRTSVFSALSPRPSGETEKEREKEQAVSIDSEKASSERERPPQIQLPDSQQPSPKSLTQSLSQPPTIAEVNEDTPTSTPVGTISQSQSAPIAGSHRRAATILDPQSRAARHERRSSTGAALFSGGGTIGRHRRPSTGYGSSSARPFGDRLFGRTDEEDENADDESQAPTPTINGVDEPQIEQNTEAEVAFKPVYLKGLFRHVFSRSRTWFSDVVN